MSTCRSLTLIFITALVISACSKKTDSDNKYPYYFKGSIDGNAVSYQANNINTVYSSGTNWMANGEGPDNTDDGSNDHYDGTILQEYGINAPVNAIGVYILKHFDNYMSPTEEEREAMYYLGNFPYGKLDEFNTLNTKNGAVIEYYDNNGEWWTSENGPQTGSTFSITELSVNNEGTSKKIMKANFSCKLYNQTGQSIQLTNGEIRGLILEY